MSLVEPAGADRKAPANVALLAVAIVTVAGLLWLIACLHVLHRRRAVNEESSLSQP
jgi:hypothetical protein